MEVKQKENKMKKMTLLMLLTLACASLCASTYTVQSSPSFYVTEYTTVTITYTTPVPVPKLDDKGNIVKDEKGSPVYVFEIRQMKEQAVLRLTSYEKYVKCAWGVVEPVSQFSEEGTSNLYANYKKEISPQAFTVIPLADGSELGLVCLDYVINRDTLPPIKCKLVGKLTFLVSKVDGRRYIGSGSGTLVGYNEIDDIAWASVQNASYAEAEHLLPVKGTWRCTTAGYMTQKQQVININGNDELKDKYKLIEPKKWTFN